MERPLVLFIRGYRASADQGSRLPESLPEADVLVADLPEVPEPSIEAFAAHFDAKLRELGRKAHVLGVSVGGLVALAMQETLSVVAADPPLQTGPIRHLIPALRRPPSSPQDAAERWSVFGDGPKPENRDYRGLIHTRCPITIVIAGLAPEGYSGPKIPGLITTADREWLKTQPVGRAWTAPDVGHNLPCECPEVVHFHLARQVATRKMATLPPPPLPA